MDQKEREYQKRDEVSKTWLPYYVVHKKVFRACQKTSRKTILEGKIEGNRRRGRPLRRWRKGDWGTSSKLEEWRKIGLCFVSLCEQRSDRMWLSFTTMKRWRFIMQFAVAKNHFIAFFSDDHDNNLGCYPWDQSLNFSSYAHIRRKFDFMIDV